MMFSVFPLPSPPFSPSRNASHVPLSSVSLKAWFSSPLLLTSFGSFSPSPPVVVRPSFSPFAHASQVSGRTKANGGTYNHLPKPSTLPLLLLLFLLILATLLGPTARQRGPFGRDAFLSSLARRLGLVALGLHLLLQDALALFLGFGFVDLFVCARSNVTSG